MNTPGNAHSVIHNYVIAGLDSYLVGELKNRKRLFHMTRNQVDYITPHSHKFDLECTVLKGCVVNTLFHPSEDGELFSKSELIYKGKPGDYEKSYQTKIGSYRLEETKYFFGQKYWIPHDAIHSIWFSKDAMVLIEESEIITETTEILEPYSNKSVVSNFNVHNGLFVKELDN